MTNNRHDCLNMNTRHCHPRDICSGGGPRTVNTYDDWVNCTEQQACTSDPFSCSNSECSTANGRLGLAKARLHHIMMRDGPDSRPWLRTVNLTKDTPGHVDPREGIVWQVETLLTQIGGRPCWKIEECVARCSAATPHCCC